MILRARKNNHFDFKSRVVIQSQQYLFSSPHLLRSFDLQPLKGNIYLNPNLFNQKLVTPQIDILFV